MSFLQLIRMQGNRREFMVSDSEVMTFETISWTFKANTSLVLGSDINYGTGRGIDREKALHRGGFIAYHEVFRHISV